MKILCFSYLCVKFQPSQCIFTLDFDLFPSSFNFERGVKMPDLRFERFQKLVLELRGLILGLIQGRRPVCRLGRADVGLIGLV